MGAHDVSEAAMKQTEYPEYQGITNTPLPLVCWSKTLYASAAWANCQRCVNRWSTAILRSATKRAQSACPIVEKVHEPITVSCLRNRSRLTSSDTPPPSPTKQTVPHALVARTAVTLPSAAPDVSRLRSAPAPLVKVLMAATGSSVLGSINASAPNSLARVSRSALT